MWRAMRRLLLGAAVSSGAVVLLAVLYPAVSGSIPAAAQDPPVHFAAGDSAVALSQPAVATLLNDSADVYRVLEVTAAVSADAVPATGAAAAFPVDVRFDIGSSTEPFDAGSPPELSPGGVQRLTLTQAQGTPAGSSGWLTVGLGRDRRVELVVRQPLSVPEKQAATGFTSWSFTSFAAGIDPTAPAGTALPLSKGSCADAGTVSGVLVTADTWATAKSGACTQGSTMLPLDITDIPGIGTYTGTVKIGSDTVTVAMTRTRIVLWPVLAILLGLVLAILAQGASDRGWKRDQSRWLRELAKSARDADDKFAGAAGSATWGSYRIRPAVEAAAARLTSDLDEIMVARGRFRGLLPWPAGFMAKERTTLRENTQRLDLAVRQWGTSPAAFAAMQAAEVPAAMDILAPKVKARRLELLDGRTEGADLAAVEKMIADVGSWAVAARVVVALDEARKRLDEIKSGYRQLARTDQDAFDGANRTLLGLSAALAAATDVTAVVDLQPEVSALVRAVTELPKKHVREFGPVDEGTQTETVAPTTILRVPGALRQVLAFLRTRGDGVLSVVMLALTVAIAVWSGLVALYLDKAWGTGVDFAAAIVWGFGTTALLSPVLAAIRGWGTPVSDKTAET